MSVIKVCLGFIRGNHFVVKGINHRNCWYFCSFRYRPVLFKHFSTCHEQYPINIVKKDVSGDFPTVFSPSDVESCWYEWWKAKNFFVSHVDDNQKLFTMILPPPNITGTLHLGHALTATIQDAIARWHHMHGERVIWVPGTDHAGIATQVVLEKQLWAKENLTRHQLGREQFLKEISKWHVAKSSVIQKQLQQLGAMLDWSREYFTLDKSRTAAVNETFLRLFDEHLIYRKKLPVNWSPWLCSTISDIEVDKLEIDGPTPINVPGYEKAVTFGTLTDIAYKICGTEEEIVVSTTRPETILGDVAVAVHPSDPRYTNLHGSYLWHPYRSEKIPLICDDMVDPAFGTGAVKITPAHDKTDFDVSMRHNLRALPVIDDHGNICDHYEIFGGMKRFEARERILDDLASREVLRRVQGHKMVIPMCSRSRDVTEVILKDQWFLSVKGMKEKAQNAVIDGTLKLTPNRMNKLWHQWFSDLQDWCLSRQLWWGHRIPAFKCYMTSDVNNFVWVAAQNEMEARSKASVRFGTVSSDQMLKVEQDEDVLDTWFSSSLLPFSAFGWPNMADYKNFYPLSLMETGNDILLFWVARMVMLGQHLTQQLPFNHVLLHGVVCDAFGRKMSKSIGNVISPEDVRDGKSLQNMINQVEGSHSSGTISTLEAQTAKEGLKCLFPNGIPACGTDALRFTLCANDIQSQVINFDVKECHANRLFGNKIWQACRYIDNSLKITNEEVSLRLEDYHKFNVMDRWILSCLHTLVSCLDQEFKNRNVHGCTHAIKEFTYEKFCDVYLESTKALVKGGGHAAQTSICVLATCMRTILLSISPFMPFLSEELFQRMGFLETNYQSIMQHSFPKQDQFIQWNNSTLEKNMTVILEAVSAVRRLKINNGFKYNEKKSVLIETNSLDELAVYEDFSSELSQLGPCNIISISKVTEVGVSSFLEERVTNGSTIKIVFLDDYERSQSNKAKEGIIYNAVRKNLKLLAEISHLKKITQTLYFKTKAKEDFKMMQHAKLKILEEELLKIESYLSKEPEIRLKMEDKVMMEKQRKQAQRQEELEKRKRKKSN